MWPILFRYGAFQLPSYSVFGELGAVLAFSFLYGRMGRMGLRSGDDFWLLVDGILVGGFVGGRLGFLATDGLRFPFHVLDLVFPLTSGFSAFGVFAGMAAGVLCFCRLFRYPYRRTLDYLCAVLPFWLATARIGCFFTGCCYGRPVRHAWPWAVTFTDPASALPRALLGVPLHPSQLYEALGDLLLGLALLPVLRAAERGELPLGTSCCAFLAGYGLLRFGLEPFRGDALTWGAISMGQFCALAFIALAMAGWLRLRAGSRSRRVLGSL